MIKKAKGVIIQLWHMDTLFGYQSFLGNFKLKQVGRKHWKPYYFIPDGERLGLGLHDFNSLN